MSNQNGGLQDDPRFQSHRSHQSHQAASAYPNMGSNRPPGMTEEERVEHRNMIRGGLALTAVPILIAIILSAAEAPIDPRLTGPVLSALLVAGAATFGRAYRFKRDALRR